MAKVLRWYRLDGLFRRESMIEECASEECAYNEGGLCHYPMVFGYAPDKEEGKNCKPYIAEREEAEDERWDDGKECTDEFFG